MLDNKIEFPWHQKTWDKFIDARSRQHLPHALLISGAEGIGKIEFAHKLVKSLLCLEPKSNNACNQCKACKTYESFSNPDFKVIKVAEDKKQISVDQIRELSKFITLSRSFAAYRVILLHPVEAMNVNAANSLLKSLEEPAENTIIILLATHLNQILPTIKSRCQLLPLPMPSSTQALEWLKIQAPQLEQAEELLDMSYGRPQLALEVNDSDLNQRNDLAEDILQLILEHKSVTEIAKKWEKLNHKDLLKWQASWLQSFIKEAIRETGDNEVSAKRSNENLNKIKELISVEHQWKLYQQIIDQQKFIHTSVNPLIFMENMLNLWFQASHQCHNSS